MKSRSFFLGYASFFVCALSAFLFASSARAETARIAVATNFLKAAKALERDFESQGKNDVQIVSGSTGKLYAQIVNGAPFDVFLAADGERPSLLSNGRLAIDGSQFTYAIGTLVLWSPNADTKALEDGAVLKHGTFNRLAIANPALAPYGAAARQVLKAYDLTAATAGKIVMGENIGQTFSMVAKGGADLGFIASTQLSDIPTERPGSFWIPPQSTYAPIRQDAVLLKRGADNDAASAFLAYLRTPRATDIISEYGYQTAR